MIPAHYRLPRRYNKLQGKSYSHPSCTLIIAPNQLDHPRFRIIIPKSQLSRAVDRHRLNRRLHHLFHSLIPSLGSVDIVCICRANLFLSSAPELNALILSLLNRANIVFTKTATI